MEIKKHFASYSGAIRAGASLRPQAFGKLFSDGRSCSIGSGIEAMGLATYAEFADCPGLGASDETYITLVETFPYLRKPISKCPTGHTLDDDIAHDYYGMIVHLNDDHTWSREQIADWLQAAEDRLFGYVTLENVPEIQVTRESRDSVVTPEFVGVLT